MTSMDDKYQILQMPRIHFCVSSYRFRYIIILIFYLQKVGKGHSTIFAITSFDGKFQNVQMSPKYFCASYYRFRHIIFLFCNLQKVDHGHSTIFAVR